MAVTAQQIAELAGVSRGTVDRALHDRGRVAPEVAARIRRIAAELGYKPNLVGQALVRTKRGFKLGAIVQSIETPTMQIVCGGVRRAAVELRASGVELLLREVRGLDTEQMLEYIEGLVEDGIQGLAISLNNAPELRRCIDELHEQGIPVVTLNSDAPGSRRLCFIGLDNYRAGRTAAGLMREILPQGGRVLPLTGHLNNTAHNNRLNGFSDALREGTAEDIVLLPFQPCFDRDDYAYEITQHALRAEPGLAGVYVSSNGQRGACQAIEEEGLKGRVKVIAFDLNETNMALLHSDSLSFVIDQEAAEQGYRPPYILYEYLMHKKRPAQELLYTDIAIRTKYNSDLVLSPPEEQRTGGAAVAGG
ncbi:MAG: LacI family DNA-binding transcriptional regulator [Eubacteriales bacterium]|nr:LacI family DNA-binding transcriptional regulator [Eubacteriales bacterium]